MNGDSSVRISFTSHVGAGSSWQDLHSAELMSISTSSLVTAVHSSSVRVALCGTSYSGVDAVDARTDSTLSLKKTAKSSEVSSCTSLLVASPSTLWNARHSFFMLPLLSAICPCQYLHCFCWYSCLKDRNSVHHVFLSSSACVHLYRLSVALAWHRALRQSASNHGVACLFLRRTVTQGQCLSSSSVSTRLYSWTRSSTHVLTGLQRAAQLRRRQIRGKSVVWQAGSWSFVFVQKVTDHLLLRSLNKCLAKERISCILPTFKNWQRLLLLPPHSWLSSHMVQPHHRSRWQLAALESCHRMSVMPRTTRQAFFHVKGDDVANLPGSFLQDSADHEC